MTTTLAIAAPATLTLPGPPEPSEVTAGVDYAFTQFTAEAGPARWMGEQPLTIATLGRIPRDAPAQIQAALTTMAAATGLTLTWTATRRRHADITIRYRRRGFFDYPRAAGLTQVTLSRSPSGVRITHATITMRTGLDPHTHQLVLLHELGHAFGATHVTNPASIMHPTSSSFTHLTPGDLYAFATLGRRA